MEFRRRRGLPLNEKCPARLDHAPIHIPYRLKPLPVQHGQQISARQQFLRQRVLHDLSIGDQDTLGFPSKS
jgi:hypothetical protein